MKCCDLYAGMLRHSIEWQQEQTTPDGMGGQTRAWATVATVRAFIKPTTGNERWHAMRTEANVTHRIFMRYRSDLTPAMRIVYNGRAFQVKAVLNIEERNKWLEVHATEGQVT